MAERQNPFPSEPMVTAISLAAALFLGLVLAWAAAKGAAIALLWSLGFLAAGFVVGFLFGVPRVLDDASSSGQTESAPKPQADGNRLQRLAVNTNLTQISDWLTKIFVGVGLVELREIPEHVARAGAYIGDGILGSIAAASGAASSALPLGSLCTHRWAAALSCTSAHSVSSADIC